MTDGYASPTGFLMFDSGDGGSNVVCYETDDGYLSAMNAPTPHTPEPTRDPTPPRPRCCSTPPMTRR